MLVQNKSKRKYVHTSLDKQYRLILLELKPQEIKDIPDEIAKTWVKSGEVIEYAEPAKAKELEAENQKLKDELKKLKETKPATKKTTAKKSTKSKTTKK